MLPSEIIFIYGPPGAGKSSTGLILAEALDLAFHDLDQEIEQAAGKSIPDLFTSKGESGFRELEKKRLDDLLRMGPAVIALGGGALLDPQARAQVERTGRVVCLGAALPTLLERLRSEPGSRPLIAAGEEQLAALLEQRRAHYASFPVQIFTDNLSPQQVTAEVQLGLGRMRVSGMGESYDVLIEAGSFKQIAAWLQCRGLHGPLAVVCDENVAALYGEGSLAHLKGGGFSAELIVLPPGEAAKEIGSVARLWAQFLELGLERRSTVIALGGGVISDLTGFAAATFMRGVPWVIVPTSLLGMVDASLGGKTGIDLPAGKNLAGAFYPPRLVLVDPVFLDTLPLPEMRCGMAEVVKAGVIADSELFALCARGWEAVLEQRLEIIRRAIVVKVEVIKADPFEGGLREVLNFGHTVGHAVEISAAYRLSHGEAVAIGMVLETRLAEMLGLAEPGLAVQISSVLETLGLPIRVPSSLSPESIVRAMGSDKKSRLGKIVFPCR